MKSAVSLFLVTALLLPSLPAAAQSRQFSSSQLSNWSRVRTIIAGARIRAFYVGRRHDYEYFISATEETITMLTPERLPRAARKAMIAIAGTRPEFFTATTWMELADGSVRVTPDGVFVKGHRVAAIEDIAVTVGRGDVMEVSQEMLVRPPRRPPFTGPGPEEVAGVAAGVAGGMLTFGACGEDCPAWAVIAGFFGPMLAVAVLAARHRVRTLELVYRAP